MEQIKNEVLETLTRILEDYPYEVDVQVDDDLVVVEIGTAATVTTFNPRLVNLTMLIDATNTVVAMKLEDIAEEQEQELEIGYSAQSLLPWIPDMLEAFTSQGIDSAFNVFDRFEETEQYYCRVEMGEEQ
ncbi:hypothetical protein GCM10007377_15480 [Galliscardovia ingluviei]|uniref:Uncharacterized protein n=1 Tax=Galliscardovia ingluviei TaxID=1769422 RepID=A0A8J3AMB9_9BIFI|nr:hypothetical protein [Galliscardovia ingluviei]GGI15354.1 hypothetical protein GCM10007377_15480 [Galliscardovia ingluviei]